jgi:excinuclease ABC subunit C
MELNMNVAAEKFHFETAAKYRDYMATINYLINREKVLEFTKENKHIALLEYLHDDSFKFFLISGNRVLFSEKYTIPSSDIESLKLTLRNNILHYFKNEDLNSLIEIGRDEIDEAQIIYSYLKSKQNNCRYIVISKEWIDDDNNSNIDEALIILFESLI